MNDIYIYTSHYSFTPETTLSAQQMLFGDDRQNSDNFLSAISSEHGHLPREWTQLWSKLHVCLCEKARVITHTTFYIIEQLLSFFHSNNCFIHSGHCLNLFVVWLWLLIKVQNNLANKWHCNRDHRAERNLNQVQTKSPQLSHWPVGLLITQRIKVLFRCICPWQNTLSAH